MNTATAFVLDDEHNDPNEDMAFQQAASGMMSGLGEGDTEKFECEICHEEFTVDKRRKWGNEFLDNWC